jgi:hypothetical protein
MQSNEQPLLPTRFSSPTLAGCGPPGIILPNNSDSHVGKILSAPLGGLPAMASQIAEAAEEKISTSVNGDTQGKPDINEDSDEENIQSDHHDDTIEYFLRHYLH